jgi:hypothetical protein
MENRIDYWRVQQGLKNRHIVERAGTSAQYVSMQAKDPTPIVAAWSIMLADLDPVVAKADVIKVCCESDYFPSVARIIEAANELDPRIEKPPTAAEAREEVEWLIIHSIAAGSAGYRLAVAVQLCKAAVNEGLDTDLETGTAYEAEVFGLCFATADQKEGMAAFTEKRKAQFTGA